VRFISFCANNSTARASLVFGDCALEETKLNPGVTNIPGCPPTSNLTPDFLNPLRKHDIEMEKIQREKEQLSKSSSTGIERIE
jgi:hypothetical protein